MPRFSPSCALAALLFCVPVARADVPATSASRTASGVMPFSTRAFRAMGLIGHNASVVRERVLAPIAPRKRAQSTRSAAADGSLLFVYKGFSAANQKVLSEFVSKNYGAMVARYGAPSPEQRANGGKTIEVIGNQFAAAYQPLLKADNATRGDGGTIYFQYDDLLSAKTNQFNFTRLILRAFQGPNNFSYDYNAGKYNDIYQAGLADAVALLVLYDSLSASEKAAFDPSVYGFTYTLAVYDLFNRPELSSAYVFPPTNDADSFLPDFRLGMAQAAWLKVAIDNPTFFQKFNAAYYAQIPARQAATPAQLRAIAAAAAPQVEGLGFADWARRQYILDNAVTTGTKVLPLIVPVETPAGGAQDTGFIGFAEAFTTDANGQDTRLTGFGTVEAFDENGVQLGANWIDPADGSFQASTSTLLNLKKVHGDFDFGATFGALTPLNRARIQVKLNFKGVQSSALFPFIGTGSAASQTTIYGVARNGQSGDLTLSNNAGTDTASLSRGAFAGTKNYLSAPAVVTQLTLGGRVFKRNTAWLPAGSRGVAFVLDGSATNAPFTFKTAAGASKVRMISLPIFPAQSDEAEVLGIAAKDLQLARYRPNLSPGTVDSAGVLTFGIGADRHEIYPNISSPIAPGRGYWLGAGELSRTVQGSEPRADQPYEVELAGGWTQFGVPFNKAFSPAAIRVRYGSFAPVSYADAVKNGLIAPGIWRWQGAGGYARADVGAGASLAPFEGFYIYALPARGISLVFNPSATTAATSTRTQSGWSVPLVASSGQGRDESNRFGVLSEGSSRMAAAKPPTGPLAVTLHFASSGNAEADRSGAGAASGWADSFLDSLGRTGKWNLSVDGVAKGEGASLSWGDLKGAPADIRLSLRDEKSGKTTALRAGGNYAWTGDGGARAFSITATRNARATLQIAPAPSRGVDIKVGLNWLAHGRLEIQTASGDTVFVIKSGDYAAKVEKFTWSGATRQGPTAAAGRYRAVWIPTLEGDIGAAAAFNWRP